MDFFLTLLDANIPVGSYHIGVLELIGVLIGLAGAILGMKRHLLTWPVGMIANVILFFVYIGATFATDYGKAPLFGQSGRQIFFILTSLYGWWRWNQVRELNKHGADQPAITPRWATTNERIFLIASWLIGLVIVQQIFATIGARWPAERWYFWCDAWIFVGSLLATYAMARGWNEFWLVWIGVDIVGVPLLLHSGYVPTAVLYAIYAGFVIYGFTVWLKASRAEKPDLEPEQVAAGSPA